MSLTFVYPNVSEVNRRGRGGLSERFELAKQTGCQYVEVPADFIKNKSEVELTGLDLGSFLDERAIARLYKPTQTEIQLGYVLHTEPSLPRTDGYGLSKQAKLEWNKPDWVKNLVQMILALCNHLGSPASFIEIHPGDSRNINENVVGGCREILEAFWKKYSSTPTILLENRTGQFISKGVDLKLFWECLLSKHSDLIQHVGIVLDVQQLFTATGKRFKQELDSIPALSIKGLHIHTKHRTPSLSDDIPWTHVFSRLLAINQIILLNPEIHHKSHVPGAIKFCRDIIQTVQQGSSTIDTAATGH
jgi:hypothetical protein